METDESRICAVCGRVLEQHRLGPDIIGYRHPIDLRAEGEDHPPVAIRPADAPGQAQYRCDFCLDEPITHTAVLDRELSMESAGLTWDNEWAMCAVCAELLMANRWKDLRVRAFENFERRHGPMHEVTKMEMRVIYKQIRDALVFVYID